MFSAFKLTSFNLARLSGWNLPTRTIFNAYDQTVTYPNGTVETWAAVERRQGGPARGVPPAGKDEDEPPPPSYT